MDNSYVFIAIVRNAARQSRLMGAALAVLFLALSAAALPAASQGCPEGEACPAEDSEPSPSVAPHFFKGVDLLTLCFGDELERTACQIYIAGAHDALEAAYWSRGEVPPWCEIVGFSSSEIADLTAVYIEDNPRFDPLPAPWAIAGALAEFFPCSAGEE